MKVTGENIEDSFRDNFESLYLSYYPGMVRFAQKYVESKEDAEDIVHDTFAEVWKTRSESLYRNYPLPFLLTILKNKCIDHLRHQRIAQMAESVLQEAYRLEIQMKLDSLESFNEGLLFCGESVDDMITKAINTLPEKCRQIFIMNVLEGKKQKEIAQELNISINTIETQMGIAYKKLKEKLKNYLHLLLFILYF